MSLFYASGFTHEVMQFGHRLLDVLCSLVSRQSMTSRESLDVLLTDALFADDDAEQLPAIAFESLFGSVKHIATGDITTMYMQQYSLDITCYTTTIDLISIN